MKKGILLAALLMILTCGCAHGEGIVLKTVSCFAGADTSAAAYVEILKAYETETGNRVEDTSAASDEAWKASVLYDFAAGNEPDVLFFFAANADSAPLLSRVVPIREINAAYPGLQLTENMLLAEADGQVYAIPARPFWEGLFINTDLFEQYGLPLPTDWEKLEQAISVFRREGIVPISVSLSDIPHYIAEFAVLASGKPEDYALRPASLAQVPASWYQGMALIRRLYEIGAFAEDVNATTEVVASQLFREKKAAMQMDGSWFANSIPPESMDTTLVMPFPVYAEDADGRAIIGDVSMGFYLTRKAWNDPEKRDAAVQLLAYLTSEESLARIGGVHYTGRLLESANAMVENAGCMLSPIQDAMTKEARETWLLGCICAVAEGDMSAEDCWERVMALEPFDK